ncbi:hypothetical protein HK096_011610, partial [Nowakowskiella sp. JEL0078]
LTPFCRYNTLTPRTSSNGHNTTSLLTVTFFLSQYFLTSTTTTTTRSSTPSVVVSPIPTITQTPMELGLMFAWLCTILYLTSRLPQIYKNFIRQTCDGLSVAMFVCAAMGNLTYTLSVLAKSLERDYLVRALPFLLGSGGTLILDLVIFFQFWLDKRLKGKRNEAVMG